MSDECDNITALLEGGREFTVVRVVDNQVAAVRHGADGAHGCASPAQRDRGDRHAVTCRLRAPDVEVGVDRAPVATAPVCDRPFVSCRD